MLEITRRLRIPDEDLTVRYACSGGPGGQNVNKVATKVEVRLHLADSAALRPAVKARLAARYPGYVTREGDVVVTSSRYRTQARNRQDAETKLAEMIRGVLTPPKPRRATKPSRAARQRRMDAKRRRGAAKQRRQRPHSDE